VHASRLGPRKLRFFARGYRRLTDAARESNSNFKIKLENMKLGRSVHKTGELGIEIN
jgi:hypothetical protein